MKIAIAVLMIANCVWGQQIQLNHGSDNSKPLTCGKYQHIDHWPGPCGPPSCNENMACTAICMPPPPDKCVDDIHFVTEKEWQELMKRLNVLEKTPNRVNNHLYDGHCWDGSLPKYDPMGAVPHCPVE